MAGGAHQPAHAGLQLTAITPGRIAALAPVIRVSGHGSEELLLPVVWSVGKSGRLRSTEVWGRSLAPGRDGRLQRQPEPLQFLAKLAQLLIWPSRSLDLRPSWNLNGRRRASPAS